MFLQPTTYLAINYMLLSRLARALGATKALLLPAGLIAKLFVLSDIVSFVLQAFGSGSSASGDAHASKKVSAAARQLDTLRRRNCYSPDTFRARVQTIVIGLVVQLVSYCIFCLIFLIFGLRV